MSKVQPETAAAADPSQTVKPNIFHRAIVKYPILMMLMIFAGMIVMLMILLAIKPALSLPYNAWFDLSAGNTQRQLAFQTRLLKPLGKTSTEAAQPERSLPLDFLTLIYESDDNILTTEKVCAYGVMRINGIMHILLQLKVMLEIETAIVSMPSLKNWCVNTRDGTCAPFKSLPSQVPALVRKAKELTHMRNLFCPIVTAFAQTATPKNKWNTSTWCAVRANNSQLVGPFLAQFVSTDFVWLRVA